MPSTKYKFFGIPVYEKRTTEPTEQRSSEFDISSIKNPKEWLIKLLEQETFSGVKVTQDTALTFSAVWACVRILSNTVAMLPFGVYQKDADGGRSSAPDHPVHPIIHDEPNEIMTSFTWRQVMQSHAVLKGNAYSIIKRNGAYRPIGLILIDNPDTVQPFLYEGKLFYKIDNVDKPYTSDEMLHIKGPGFDGIKGKSVLSVARESIGSALAMQEYGGKVFQSGGSKRVALMHEKALNPQVKDNIRNSWNATYEGSNNSHKVAILEGGVTVQEIGMNPEDAQFIASRQFSVNEIARYFGMIMDLLASDNNPTYASAEQRAIDFIKYTMNPWFTTWESEVNRKLFPASEKKTFYAKFSAEGLLRGDATARAQYYKDLFYIGALNRDEIRSLEERNKIEGGENFYLQTNMAPAEKVGLDIIKP
jgi:HK97 family phage portal protein